MQSDQGQTIDFCRTLFCNILMRRFFFALLNFCLFFVILGHGKILFWCRGYVARSRIGIGGDAHLLGEFRYYALRFEESCKLSIDNRAPFNARTGKG